MQNKQDKSRNGLSSNTVKFCQLIDGALVILKIGMPKGNILNLPWKGKKMVAWSNDIGVIKLGVPMKILSLAWEIYGCLLSLRNNFILHFFSLCNNLASLFGCHKIVITDSSYLLLVMNNSYTFNMKLEKGQASFELLLFITIHKVGDTGKKSDEMTKAKCKCMM